MFLWNSNRPSAEALQASWEDLINLIVTAGGLPLLLCGPAPINLQSSDFDFFIGILCGMSSAPDHLRHECGQQRWRPQEYLASSRPSACCLWASCFWLIAVAIVGSITLVPFRAAAYRDHLLTVEMAISPRTSPRFRW